MLFNSPISPEKADLLIGLLDLEERSQVVDVGCGTGEFLVQVLEKYPATGIGVDLMAESLAEAREKAADRGCSDRVKFVEGDVREMEFDSPFDLGICMGASHAYSVGEPAYPKTLKGLGAILQPGGLLLMGESYWMQEPEQEYLDFVGEPNGTYRSHLENVELAAEFGFTPVYCNTSSLDEWDDFEWRHHMRIEARAEANPDDPELAKRKEFGRKWRNAYLRWGRGTLGFGFYLFQKES